MKRTFLLIFSAVIFSSCAEVQYLDEALRLKEYSDETDAREVVIAGRQRLMAGLVERISRGEDLADIKTKDDLVANFGEPVLVKSALGKDVAEWLYRDPVRYSDAPKVYFLIDGAGRVASWTQTGISVTSKTTMHEKTL